MKLVRMLIGAILLGAILLPSLSQADDPAKPEPPVRLKKKKRPQPADEEPEKAPEKRPTDKNPDAKVGDKKDEKTKDDEQPKLRRPGADDEPAPADDGEDSKEMIARVSKNMRAAEDRLAKKDPGEATRGIQRDIIKDLDKLIEESKRQQQQQQQGGGGSASPRRRQQQNAGGKDKSGQNQTTKNDTKKGGQKPREGQGKDKEGKGQGKEGKGGGSSAKGGSKIADLYKDIWGMYPEKDRQEMDTYSREQFMEKYKGLLKQYYSTLSEKARSKENE